MMKLLLLYCLVCIWLYETHGFVLEDAVEKLPGWNGELPSPMFAGYLDGGTKRDGKRLHYHYTFILSENDPENDPVLLWTNGGPGAGSDFGLYTELGPLFVSLDSLKTREFNETGIPTLFRNPYSWTKVANLLVLNGPPPVGYSYCDPPGPGGSGFDCGPWEDYSTAEANFQMLESFYKAFPAFADHDLYLSGESYAGIYIPTLVQEILKHDPSESVARKNLKGAAIGDGCVGSDIICSQATGKRLARHELLQKALFLYGHHQISTKLYNKIQKLCKQDDGEANTSFNAEECDKAFVEMDKQAGFYFEYNLYDTCFGASSLPGELVFSEEEEVQPQLRQDEASILLAQERRRRLIQESLQDEGLSCYPCGGGAVLSKWIQTPQVKAALHVREGGKYVSGDNSAALNYTMTAKDLRPVHKNFASETKLRILIYNGDTDPALNSFLGEWWTSGLGLEETQSWRPWTLDGKKMVMGYVTRYAGEFDYVTIRGSGHMVPQNKPRASLEMLERWLKNEDWKPQT